MSNKRVIIITGGNRGLGKALSDNFLKNTQDTVVSISRSQTKDQEDNPNFIFIAQDLSQINAIKCFENISKIIQDSNIIYFNNAFSIEPIAEIGKMTASDIQRSILLNVLFPVQFVNEIKKIKYKSLSVINLDSGASENPIDNWSLYSSAKAFNKMFFNCLQSESKKDILFDNSINIDPGVMDTQMQSYIRNSQFKGNDKFQDFKKLNKLKSVEDVALSIIAKL